ncbi:hypothetical protein [Haloarcula marismortui]|uniref:Uncharacterized protein n=1 Tax=Haloarcula marismortui ATCC 33800 TaxID=662476 RepID=A0A8T8KKB7_9EURY|nr:hypothetical protein [Haloarcula sinaiiensis]QUJ71953.1 hypothetical protein KDQ40_14870 [Haloarcula sinaiiensis ATCC 33800]
MVWSGEHPKGVDTANTQIDHAEAHLPEDVIEDCKVIAECCHDPLESHAEKRHEKPVPSSIPSLQAKNLVDTVSGSNSYEASNLDAFEKVDYDFDLNDTQIKMAKEIVGLEILKNGTEEETDDTPSIPERLKGVISFPSASD